jgi:Galactose oxidase-like, Early set domain/Glyoxal oxidase N-terminus/Kelch motif
MARRLGNERSSLRVAGRRLARQPKFRWLSALTALMLLLLTQEALAPSKAHADPAQIGAWTAPFNIGAKGIHSQVLPNGKVLLWSYPVGTVGTSAVIWDPATQTYTNVSISYPRDTFCSGHDLLPNGQVFVTGGHAYNASNPAQHEDGAGVTNTDIFNPGTQTWTPGPQMSQARWYPTNVELGNGHVLIFSGQVSPTTKSPLVEEYDPAANTISTLPSTATKTLPLYPRMILLPNGKMFYAGPAKGTQLFNPATNSWSWVGNTKFNAARNEGNAVLLPGLNKVLIAGGRNGTTGATNTAEVIDFSQAKPTWAFTGSMTYARAYANGVLLPDGKVLEVGGGTGGAYTSPVYTAELYNPDTGTWSTMAAQTAPRIYHSTAVLLPNGQVLSAGMDNGSFQFTGELYSPPYLFAGARPTISSSPTSVSYGQSLGISTPNASSITRVALIKPAGATHALAQDQRYVDLSFTHTSSGQLTATAPPDGNHAPPGWYMLFILDSNGVPSVASWVDVG